MADNILLRFVLRSSERSETERPMGVGTMEKGLCWVAPRMNNGAAVLEVVATQTVGRHAE